MGFGEPDGRAEVVDVSVGQQNGVDVVDVETELPDGAEDFLALAREACVDEDHAVAVGDERPVHEIGLREVDGVGDGRQLDWVWHGHSLGTAR